jgi:hypothetical protein
VQVDFRSDTWRFVEDRCKKFIENQMSNLTQTDKSYKDLLLAQGQIQAFKTILALSTPPALTAPAAHKR